MLSQLCQEFRSTSAMVLATLITAEMVVCETTYEKQTIANVWQFVGSLGLSKADLSNALRSQLDSMPATGSTEKPKPDKTSKRKRQDPEAEKPKRGKDKKKRKH